MRARASFGGQGLVADRFAETADHGRDLGVEQRSRYRSRQVMENLNVLPCGMKDLKDFRVVHQPEQGG